MLFYGKTLLAKLKKNKTKHKKQTLLIFDRSSGFLHIFMNSISSTDLGLTSLLKDSVQALATIRRKAWPELFEEWQALIHVPPMENNAK